MELFQAIILAIIEGLTEFLPVSSTGHMIIAAWLMGIESNEFVKTYEVAIQLGAILSVVVLYVKRFFNTINFYFKLAFAFLPTGILGYLLNKHIDALLENIYVVATSLLLGGIVLVFIDRIFKEKTLDGKLADGPVASDIVTYRQGFLIGLWQSIAMIPGVSRSAASIIGGQAQGLSRKAAAEFSFFLAVPTMAAATGYKLYQNKEIFADDELVAHLLIGNVIAFIVGMLAIRFFIRFLTKYGFKVFGYYRIGLSLIIFLLLALGVELHVD